MTTQNQPTLPGFDLGSDDTQTAPAGNATRLAVSATITSLHADELLEPRHAAICQLALALADSVDRAMTVGRPSGMAMVARELRETLSELPAPTASTAEDKFAEFVKQLELAANAGQPAAQTNAGD